MALSAGTCLGPYEIVEPLGAGGMGEVYRARDPRLRREVAVKLVTTDGTPSPERLRRFETEARAAAQLSHPNVITVFDVGTHEGQPYLVLELLEGKTLREALRGAPPSVRVAVGWGLECARGLGAAHERGIVHRDLKPENIFLTEDGRIKILDFGLAKLHEPLGDEAARESPTEAPGTKPGMVLGTVGYMAPEQVRGEKPDARADVFALGAVLYELVARRRPFEGSSEGEILSAILHAEPPPLVSPSGAVFPALEGVVRRCLEKDPRDRFHSAHGVALALEAVREAPAAGVPVAGEPEERGPYPGLRFFTEEDAGRFFGREGEVESLWERLKARTLLAVIGPSGAGKSSFIRAGVVASRPTGWGALVCTPGSQAFRGLGEALAPELADDPDALRKLLEFEETAFELVTRWRARHGEALLVVDQLEELFTLNPSGVQEAFAGLLGRLSSEGDVHVVLSLRDDFLMRCAEHEVLSKVFTELTPLPPLEGDALRRAVEEPARREGFALEEGLVEEMLQAVEGSRGALPLLAFAMSRLWEARDRERKLLTRAAYERIGGVAGALAQHAEQTLERIGPQRQPLVREIFRNLVTAQGTRASLEREELLSVFEDREAVSEALQELIGARLLTSYEVPLSHPERGGDENRAKDLADEEGRTVSALTTHRVEVVHESLLKAWPRLVMWQAQDEEGAVLRDQLRQAARLWEERGRSPDVLWTGSSLRDYEVWRERYRGNLTALEESFAEAMRERESRRRRWRRIAATWVVVVSLAVAIVVGISRQQAVRQAERAEQEALRAEASKLLALADARLEDDPTEALALTTASLELADTTEARVFAVRALSETPPAIEALASVGSPGASDVKFSPDGRWLATIGVSEEGLVWSDTGDGPAVLPGHAPNLAGGLKARWMDGQYLVTGNHGAERAHVWSVPSWRKLRTIEFGALTGWWIGRGGRLVAATGEDEESTGGPSRVLFRGWDLPDGEAEVLNWDRGSEPYNILFEPGGRGWIFVSSGREVRSRMLSDGVSGPDRVLGRHSEEVDLLYEWPDRLVSRDRGGETRVWWPLPPEGPALDRVIPHPPGAPTDVIAAPSGRWLFDPSFADDRRLMIWDTTALPGARPLELRRSASWILSRVDFRPGGDWVAVTTHQHKRVTLWPLARRRPSVVDGFPGTDRTVAFDPEGRWLAATAWNGPDEGVRLWSLPGRGENVATRLSDEAVKDFTFDPGGRHLLALGGTGGIGAVSVVPLDGSPARQVRPPDEVSIWSWQIALSPSGRRVAAAFYFPQAAPRLWVKDLGIGEVWIHELPPTPSTGADEFYRGAVGDLHFVDESTLYTAGEGGLRRWDLDTGAHEVVWAPKPGEFLEMAMDAQGKRALTHVDFLTSGVCHPVELHTVATGEHRPLPEFGTCVTSQVLDPSGRVVATGDHDGIVRVGSLSAGVPHLLLGHEGPVRAMAISPDLRWVGSMGEDNTLRLWPLPDLETPPLHALPHDELIAKLKTLTNLRAVRDPDDATGWTIDLDPFPGWKNAPEW